MFVIGLHLNEVSKEKFKNNTTNNTKITYFFKKTSLGKE
jgi:hypothetical protein